ncbi:hypothetical protein FN846DRAFT_913369 [Sphaerosporella brunnea]|uniref:Uncharacterized protein n=1 Tax=Sphaerosporella brunnea TaxID=1250544 RepID=A0A5J5EG08_9PEZI|nr:hypothetical protein FN846DRAFT_913369 [Sphaerosporella brunnea]
MAVHSPRRYAAGGVEDQIQDLYTKMFASWARFNELMGERTVSGLKTFTFDAFLYKRKSDSSPPARPVKRGEAYQDAAVQGELDGDLEGDREVEGMDVRQEASLELEGLDSRLQS